MLEESAFEVRGEEAVLDIHTRSEGFFGYLAEDYRLVGRLLSVLGEKHDPAYIEGSVNVVVPAMDIEGVLGEGTSGDLEYHCRELAWSMVVLLDTVDDPLAGGEIDRSLAGNGGGDGAPLGGVFAFALDRGGGASKDVELTLGSSKFVHLAHFRRRRNRIIDPRFGNACFRVGGYELISIRGNAYTRILGFRCYHIATI